MLQKGETVDAFQNVTIAARAMASDGLIHIIVEHLESQSGKRVDRCNPISADQLGKFLKTHLDTGYAAPDVNKQ
ncbi:hypothetical protein ACFS07_35470 [Undibacterium arcticum]